MLQVASRNLINLQAASRVILCIVSSLQMRQTDNKMNERKMMYIFHKQLR